MLLDVARRKGRPACQAPASLEPPAVSQNFRRLRRWQRITGLVVGVGHPLALLLTWLLLRFTGERWWLPLVGLYAPPVGFLLPAPIALLVTWRWAGRWWLALQGIAVLFALFALLGLSLGLGRDGHAAMDPMAIRLVSYNIQQGARGVPEVVAEVMKHKPNLVLLQEAMDYLDVPLREAFRDWYIDRREQFFVASRFPIRGIMVPRPLHYRSGEGGGTREGEGGAHFMAYTLDTPWGQMDVLNVHTTSPRDGLEDMRGRGFLHELRRGRIRLGDGASVLTFNAYRRRRQIEGVAAAARASANPVIIAGDFNLPGLSRVVADALGDYDDAFVRAGRGFGYTYPTKLPFLRIDRIFTGQGLKAVDFRNGEGRASDHLAVGAVIVPSDR